MTVTIDASVWVAARFEAEPGYADSVACTRKALGSPEPIVLPWLAWVECVAAVARKTEIRELAESVGRQLRRLPGIQWAPLDEAMAEEASRLASECRLRAADAVYVAVAYRHRATLVTLDSEVIERCGSRVRCLTPLEWGRASR